MEHEISRIYGLDFGAIEDDIGQNCCGRLSHLCSLITNENIDLFIASTALLQGCCVIGALATGRISSRSKTKRCHLFERESRTAILQAFDEYQLKNTLQFSSPIWALSVDISQPHDRRNWWQEVNGLAGIELYGTAKLVEENAGSEPFSLAQQLKQAEILLRTVTSMSGF